MSTPSARWSRAAIFDPGPPGGGEACEGGEEDGTVGTFGNFAAKLNSNGLLGAFSPAETPEIHTNCGHWWWARSRAPPTQAELTPTH